MTDTAKRIPVAVSGEQADLIHRLNNILDNGFAGEMGVAQLKQGRKDLDRLWTILAEQRIALGISKGSLP